MEIQLKSKGIRHSYRLQWGKHFVPKQRNKLVETKNFNDINNQWNVIEYFKPQFATF